MEDTLRVASFYKDVKACGVLILVLMEDTLRDYREFGKEWCKGS